MESLLYQHHLLNAATNNNIDNINLNYNHKHAYDINSYDCSNYEHHYDNDNTSYNVDNNKDKVAELGFLERLPPGFRFHPTDEELVGFYLQKKMEDSSFIAPGFVIREADFNAKEPWQLVMNNSHCSTHLNDLILCENEDQQQQQQQKQEQQQQCEGACMYFYSRRGSKYSTGTRANRATPRGYWKATGKDRPIMTFTNSTSCSSLAQSSTYTCHSSDYEEAHHPAPAHWRVIGIKKTLVFYFGRAPHGLKTNWIMHEYAKVDARCPSQVNGWVLCRMFFKNARGKLGIPSILEEFSSIPHKLPPLDPEVETLSIPSPTERMFDMPSTSQPRETIPISITLTSPLTNISQPPIQETNMQHFHSHYNYTQAHGINEHQALNNSSHMQHFKFYEGSPQKSHDNNDYQMFLEV